MTIPDVTLNSGHKMPIIGLGTSADAPRPPTEELAAILVDAIEMGYRHFDTARAYSTEEAVGMAVKEAVKRGLIQNRDEVFITTKLWCTDAHPDLVIPALRNSLQSLKMEYVDLFLIHWPVRLKQDVALCFDLPKEAILPFDMKGTWEAMEECCRLGLAKSVGVSNFSSKKISLLLQNANIPPAVNQVEMNTGWQQQELLEYCEEKGIQLSAWSPLGAYGRRWGSNSVMECTLLKEIANAKGNKTLAQVALRWIYEQGAGIVVKSFNTERMKQNLEIFDFKLSEEEREMIRQLPQKKGYAGDMFIYEHGPYKSYEELWDSPVVGTGK